MKRLFIVTLLLGACAHREYTAAPIVTRDDDRHPIKQPPAYWSSLYWDGADQMAFLPMVRALSVDVGGPAVNVNAHGEVPSSSWFTNRLGHTAITPERLARGPCREDDYLSDGPWIATSGKAGGSNAGFVVEDAKTHKRYVLKFDAKGEGVRGTAADVIVSKLYWAFGYNVPCNFIVHFKESHVQLGSNATKLDEFQHKIPLTQDDIDTTLQSAERNAEGLVRASASLFVEGTPLGPWTYQGRRSDDPNDVVNHEDRRDLRGGKLMAAWTQHFDSREENTLGTFMKADDSSGWIEHWLIDFGDCFGSEWASDDVSRRFGYSYYLDFADIFSDLFTFGLRERVWERVAKDPNAEVWGYFEYEHFVPDDWKGGYQNIAFIRMDEADAYWAAQIMARFTEADLDAVIATGLIEKAPEAKRLRDVLFGRRQRIIRRYMYRMSAFERPQLSATQLCFEDALVATGFEQSAAQRYETRRDGGQWQPLTADSNGALCVPIDAAAPAMVEARVTRPGAREAAKPVRFHMLPSASGVPYLNGLERVTP